MSAIVTFFQKHLAQHADEVDEHIKTRRARLSAAALLVEVVNADGEFTHDERRALFAGIQAQFSLSDGETTDLLALAESQAREATDLHEFTVALNKHFTPDRKLALIEELWRAAYADANLHRHEEQLIRKIANLLHLTNSSVLAAKHRAQSTNKDAR